MLNEIQMYTNKELSLMLMEFKKDQKLNQNEIRIIESELEIRKLFPPLIALIKK